MYNKNKKYKSLTLISLIIIMLLSSCAEKNSSNKRGLSIPDPPLVNTDLCPKLLQNTNLTDELKNKYYLNELCNTYINDLSSNEFLYIGSENPNLKIKAEDKQNGNTYTQLWGAMLTSAETQAYYNMVKLQITDPEEFKNQNFEYDKDIQIYDILNKTFDSVNYRYKNVKHRNSNVFSVEYCGITKFLNIKVNDLYLTTMDNPNPYIYIILNDLDQNKKDMGNVSFLKSFIIIYKNKKLNGTHVIFMTEQIAENENNHNIAVEESINAFKADIIRAYNNSLKLK